MVKPTLDTGSAKRIEGEENRSLFDTRDVLITPKET